MAGFEGRVKGKGRAGRGGAAMVAGGLRHAGDIQIGLGLHRCNNSGR